MLPHLEGSSSVFWTLTIISKLWKKFGFVADFTLNCFTLTALFSGNQKLWKRTADKYLSIDHKLSDQKEAFRLIKSRLQKKCSLFVEGDKGEVALYLTLMWMYRDRLHTHWRVAHTRTTQSKAYHTAAQKHTLKKSKFRSVKGPGKPATSKTATKAR
ncbi:hypothetical protein BJ165DRAFT_1030663 [Panaeolus papilionaceus]|nr:hypothetical protein BJ165DRAFT_1030663 [Panaeolus papilionaceus]